MNERVNNTSERMNSVSEEMKKPSNNLSDISKDLRSDIGKIISLYKQSTITPKQQQTLSQFSDKQLRQELYRRNKPVKTSERDKPKCINCKHKVCFTDAVKMQKKGLLTMKFSTIMRRAICLVNEDDHDKGHYRVAWNERGCGKFEKKERTVIPNDPQINSNG